MAGPNRDLRIDPQDRLPPADDERPAKPKKRETTKAKPATPPAAPKKLAKSKANRRSLIGRAIYWGAVLALWGIIAVVGLIGWVGAHLPSIQSLEVPKRPPSIQIAGIDGKVMVTRGDSGVSATIKELPKYLPQAFIAIEDRRFNSHFGVDPMGIARAAFANILRRGVSQGGSTLTQQLAKNLFLTQDRTFTRKLQELLLAFWLERKFTKNEILELYLNRVYFGAGAYGVEAAAQRYFGKHAREASLQESAMLAGLVRSPSRLAPTRNPNGAERRAQVVLSAMADAGFISDKNAAMAMALPAHALKQTSTGSINYVADYIMDVLDDLVGRVEDDIVVETSIDPALQLLAERALAEELQAKGGKLGVEQGAIVSMSPDGAVRAMIGGRDYAESQYNRAVAAKRQPGSAFKPFVYLTALERGLTPDTMREDKPIVVKGWRPENYTREYYGPVTLTQALAMSLNTVSVRLTLEFGPDCSHPHSAQARHRFKACAQCLDRPWHFGSFGPGNGVGVCDPRQQWHGHCSAFDRKRARQGWQDSLSARPAKSGSDRRAALCGDDEHDDAGDPVEWHRPQGRSRRTPGRGQDRHQPGFPRRLVRGLHGSARHRCMARQ